MTRKSISRYLDGYFELILALSMLSIMLMMLVVVADVVCRNLLNTPIHGSYELVEVFLVASIFLALSSVIANRQEITIDIIDGMLPSWAVRALKAVTDCIGMVVLVFILWSMLRPAHESYQYGEMKLELGLPIWFIWVLALFGLFSGIVSMLRRMFQIGKKESVEKEVFAE
jgi:TRAP-type C4-dicarboxylate transport system permease small subunit